MDSPFPPFQPHAPVLLGSPTTSGDGTSYIRTPHSVLGAITGPGWNMIASTSSMWQDHKHSMAITYSTLDNATEGHQFNEKTTWCSDANKTSSTSGISHFVAGEPGRVYDWRGTGWLKWVTTRWEIVGFGEMPLAGTGAGSIVGRGGSIPVLVTFVRKTMLSPQALSVLVRPQLDDGQKAFIIKQVSDLLKGVGHELSIC
ncbi:uncharacterized protein PG986_006491 [Apiospora aurea]|uniref:Uncharacterized protein n=1 Tax=Apiospora aurea TaxID=335848 RepID=A0ABR1QL11_9PEZI